MCGWPPQEAADGALLMSEHGQFGPAAVRSTCRPDRIALQGIESSQRLGRHRWAVERSVAWLVGCRRLHRRYERKAGHFLAFAAALICYRRLAKILVTT